LSPDNTSTQLFLHAGISYDVVGWWYENKPANLDDGQMVTIGIWEPDPFTTSTPREPVVIVPGIMGSIVTRVSDGEEVWPNIGKMASLSGILSEDSYLNDLALDAGGQPLLAMSTPDIVRTVTTTIAFVPIQKTFYGNLVDAFVSKGYTENKDLFVVPYDWRLDVRSQANALDAKIASVVAASPNGKINIVAHSMGGVFVKDYLASRADNSFLDKLVLVGVPQLGAPTAFKILNNGDNLGVALGPFDVLSSAEIKKIAQNMPSIYELLPGRRYVQIDGGYVRDFRDGKNTVLGYDETVHLMTSDPADSRNTNLLNIADAFHQGLDAQAVHASDIYNVLGCLKPTISQFNLYDDGVTDVTRTTGDGTVPEVSAMNLADGFHNYFVLGDETGIGHPELVSDPRSLTLITSIIENSTSTSGNLPQGVSTALAACAGGGSGSPDASAAHDDSVEFSVHGSADLNVYDAAGRHAGPLPDGTTEINIPGSSYEKMGKNIFVTVPASATSTYKVVGRATVNSEDASSTTSMVTIKAKGRKKSTVQHAVTYVSVPLENASATAELDFSGFDGDLALKFDEDGDGNADATSSPDAILTDTSSTDDVTPPDITLPAIPAEAVQGSTTMLVFGATDAGSGVAAITATLNGDTVSNGQVITFVKPGGNVFMITAVDKAGNPRTRELDFEVIAPPEKYKRCGH
jgi:pimeloyl-ACP methyl ester carboxylesterase